MYDLSTITYDTEIDICRNQDIKFDVTIEDTKKNIKMMDSAEKCVSLWPIRLQYD